MPRTNDPDDDWEESDYAGFDTSDSDDDLTAPCPHCEAEIFEGAERCPACGKYLSREDSRAAAKPLWVVAGAVICLLIAVIWIFGGC